MGTDPIFNAEDAMQRVDNDRDLFTELVTLFFEEWPRQVAALEDACRRQGASEVQHIAHSLKSALGNLGAMRAFRTAFHIEMAGKSSQITDATALLEKFKSETEAFKKEAHEFCV